MSDEIPKPLSAVDRTIPMFEDSRDIEPEDPTVREPTTIPTDMQTLLRWEQSTIMPENCKVSVIRFSNGSRGLRFDRVSDGHSVEYLIAPDMWIALAQIVFRDSKLLPKLLGRPDLQEDNDIQALRVFMFTGKE